METDSIVTPVKKKAECFTFVVFAGVVLSLAFLGAGFQVVDHFSPEVNKYYYEQADMCTTAAYVLRTSF